MNQIGVSIDEWNERMADQSPLSLLAWANERFGQHMLLACSFGAEDVALVDMYCRVAENPRIFYLDTDKHFEQTYETRDRLAERYGIKFIRVKPALTIDEQAQRYGEELWLRSPDLCCSIRKVEPLKNILKGQKAWVTGIRREQSFTRLQAQKIEWDARFELVKLNPLAFWKTEDVWSYIKSNHIPYNPLHDQGYPSIGCSVCTKPVREGEDSRSGRWAGTLKTECGLHR